MNAHQHLRVARCRYRTAIEKMRDALLHRIVKKFESVAPRSSLYQSLKRLEENEHTTGIEETTEVL